MRRDGELSDACWCFDRVDVIHLEVCLSNPTRRHCAVCIDSAQSPLLKRPARISIHGLIIDAMNSSRLFEAQKCKPGCSSNLQVKPSSEYPPSPKGHESERFIWCVRRRNESRFMSIPSCALSRNFIISPKSSRHSVGITCSSTVMPFLQSAKKVVWMAISCLNDLDGRLRFPILSLLLNLWREELQTVCLLSGREMTNDRKSIIHLSINLISSGVASATSLFLLPSVLSGSALHRGFVVLLLW